jgi:hypothetical protein
MNAINRVPTVNHVSTFPEGATHAGLTEVRSVINFEKGCFETEASQMVVVSRLGSGYLMDAKHRVPTRHRVATGIEIVCLQVVFYEEVGGVLVQLKGKVHGMGVVEINKLKHKEHEGHKEQGRPLRRTSRRIRRARRNVRLSDILNVSPIVTEKSEIETRGG